MLKSVVLLSLCAGVLGWLFLKSASRAVQWWAWLAGRRTQSELASLFVFVSAGQMLAITVLVAMLLALLAWLFALPLVLVMACALAGLALPRIMVQLLRTRWRSSIARQLPDALGLWAALLRAGQGTTHALAQVAARQAAPLGAELRMVMAQLRLGVSMESAVAGLCERSSIADLRLLSTLLATHRELGGNLAESLQHLADLLRGRLVMTERVRSLTAQGRLQGVVVGVLPLLVLVALYLMEPEAMQVLHTTWYGLIALATIGVLELAGFVLIRRIVRVDP